MLTLFINDFLKLFFIMTPFFVLSSFLSMTQHLCENDKRRIAVKVSITVIISCFLMFFFGKYIFELFGITLDAFRIGAGSVLFLSGLNLIRGETKVSADSAHADIAVVPLSIPITVGPGVIGVLMVMGAEPRNMAELFQFSASLSLAGFCIGVLLFSSSWLDRIAGKSALSILQKITGLFVVAIAAQIVFTGIKGFLIV